jgi:hypothetical protein
LEAFRTLFRHEAIDSCSGGNGLKVNQTNWRMVQFTTVASTCSAAASGFTSHLMTECVINFQACERLFGQPDFVGLRISVKSAACSG